MDLMVHANNEIVAYDNRFLASKLFKAAQFLNNAPNFGDADVLKVWLEELSKQKKETIIACFQGLKKAIDSGRITNFPKLAEFFAMGNRQHDEAIQRDIERLYKSRTVASTKCIYSFKSEVGLSDIAFYYLKTQFLNMESFQVYIQNTQFKDITETRIKEKLSELYMRHDKDDEFKKEVKNNLLYTSNKNKEVKIDEDDDDFTKKIMSEIKKENSFLNAKYCYDLDGSIYVHDGKNWKFVRKVGK